MRVTLIKLGEEQEQAARRSHRENITGPGDSVVRQRKRSERQRQIQLYISKTNLAASALALLLVFPIPLPTSVPSTVFGELTLALNVNTQERSY